MDDNHFRAPEGHQEQSMGFPHSLSHFPWLDYVQCPGLGADPDDPWQLKYHICPHVTRLNVTQTIADVVSRIRELK